jgi:hypothetical protein
MTTRYELSGGVEVTRWWNNGSYRWTLHSETLDVGQIAELAALIDPVVFKALYDRAWAQRWEDGE